MLPGKKGGNREEPAVLWGPKGCCQFPPPLLTDVKTELHYHSPPETTVWALSCGIKKQWASATVPSFVCPGGGAHRGCGQGERPSRCPGRQLGSSCACGRCSASESCSSGAVLPPHSPQGPTAPLRVRGYLHSRCRNSGVGRQHCRWDRPGTSSWPGHSCSRADPLWGGGPLGRERAGEAHRRSE